MAMPLSPELQRQLSRFKRLPESQDIWEGAIVALPTWVDTPGGDPYRPRAAVWASTTRQLAHLKMLGETAEVEAALAALAEMGSSSKLAGYRPRAVHVDAHLADMLRESLGDLGLAFNVADERPAVRAFIHAMADGLSESPVAAALDAPGVTPARLSAFGDAAKRFFDAAPWRHLDDEDLIKVESPKAGRGLSLFAVMGSAGQQFGLGFFSSTAQYREILDEASIAAILQHGGEWAIYFSPGWEMPFADVDAWETHRLPLASDRAYPSAMRLHPDRGPQRPDAGRLAYFEGLLRVLADTTESEMDAGRWSRTVETADGEQTYVLTLPGLLDAVPSSSRPTAISPLEQAEDLIDDAYDAGGRRQLQLIRRALALSPDCAVAYLLLAERTSSPSEARPIYEQAVAAAERALGPDAFTDPDRSFWSDLSTRPYMRARGGLAECLLALGDLESAASHFRALLQLNPGDNQGLRYRLLTTLLLVGRNADAGVLLQEYTETSPPFTYAAVLLALRAADHRDARRLLRAALKLNRRVPAYLIGQKDLPEVLPSHYAIGSVEEAVLCAHDLLEPWLSTPGAVEWLRVETRKR
jgi:tetratricopeptide (TPR) repeat protein